MHRKVGRPMPRWPAMAGAVFVWLVAVPPGADGSERAHLDQSYGQVPLAFEANTGQTDPQVAFLARGASYALFLTPREAVLSLRAGVAGQRLAPPRSDRPTAFPPSVVLRVKLRGATRSPRLTGLEPQPGRSHYFIGNDPARWRTDVPHFGKVRYEQVYPGIDLVYYGRQRQLEFDFLVQPGADPRRIRLEFQGADRMEVDAAGDLLVHVGSGVLRQHKPVVYQERDGERVPVAGSYVLNGRRRVSVRVGDYDRARVL